jgi:hypothetical protein
MFVLWSQRQLYTEDEGNMFPRNAGGRLPDYTVSTYKTEILRFTAVQTSNPIHIYVVHFVVKHALEQRSPKWESRPLGKEGGGGLKLFQELLKMRR